MLLSSAPVTGVAQRPAVDSTPTLAALRVAHPITLDGAPDEAVWLEADSLVEFRQKDPAEGAAGTQRTVVRVLAHDAGLYVGAWMYQAPDQLVRAHLRRDDNMEADDYIALLLDSQRDRRSGYVFGTNPNGMLFDGEIVGPEELNTDWNGVWDVRTRVTPFGWTAEFFIPWQNLRYGAGATSFGFNVERVMRRSSEKVLWRAWLRQQGLLYQEGEGTLVVPGPLPPRQIVEARPYVAATAQFAIRAVDSSGAYVRTAAAGASGKVGLDAKVAVAPTLTLDLTANTDFAQVEADRQVVNLTRFPVFFPEKRQFFLESAGIFNFGQIERTSLFNSRRIGLDTSGNVVPIVGGVRLSGRAGHERVGLLAVRTGAGENAGDAALRVQHDVLSRGYVGGMATWQGGPGIGTDRFAGGLDFQLPLLLHGQNLIPQGFVAVVRNSGGAAASAWRLFLDYPNDHANHFLAISRIEGGFDPALGFVLQRGVQRQTGQLEFLPRPHRWGVRKLLLKVIEFDVSENLDGSLNNAFYEVVPLGAAFERGDEFAITLRHADDVPRDTFQIFPGIFIPPGRYGWNRAQAQFMSTPARRFGVNLAVSAGGFYTGHAEELQYGLDARLEPHVIAGVEGGLQWVALAAGSFTAQVHRLRLDYAATPRLNGTVFLQWDNESNRMAVNARIHWIPRPGADAYLVWNTTWPTELTGGIPWGHPSRGGLVGKLVWYLRG